MFKKINLIPGLSLTLLLFFSACQKEAPLTIDNESDEVHYALAGLIVLAMAGQVVMLLIQLLCPMAEPFGCLVIRF